MGEDGMTAAGELGVRRGADGFPVGTSAEPLRQTGTSTT
jgi:hypothetical protein